MGGWIMLHIALKMPDLIHGLVGIAAAPDFIPQLMKKLPPHLLEDYNKNGCFIYPTPLNPNGWPILKTFVEDGFENCLLEQSIPIQVPVRLLHGLLDDEVNQTVPLTLSARLTSSDVHIHFIKDGDHRLCRPSDLDILGCIVGKL
jgi:pimeloyl-ACP methyl ester carboxylesterase